MLKNNLAVILAKKQIKISRMAVDTGLSRTTLTSLSQNETKRIDNDTLNTILMYLKLTPNDFFDFLRYDFNIKILNSEFDVTFSGDGTETIFTVNDAKFDLFIELDDKTGSRKPVYEFEIRESKGYNKGVSNTVQNYPDENFEVFEAYPTFEISAEEGAKSFQDFAEKEISETFQSDLNIKILEKFKECFINAVLEQYPKADKGYLLELSEGIFLTSPSELLGFELF